ncbi:ABC transporter ATP-binding protein [Isoptericola variabilis]|uniref:Xenobiotic-transporting ATPase n=1 Tax=Isoptericola variabilis (strain 225) TaxID=743718 RepID=F6FWV2_ISOV2|nr:ABC transporter ATP-binding protein [Isoptericola variabilis]AEG43524.1 Xenobiotic-transporting ATPase [Isoptericola variabilis 225]TWH32109.1 ABC-type multidrug transport system fused ATPase/permease subunit [Isoptericola variabilis J7]
MTVRPLPLPDTGTPPLTSAARLLTWQAWRQRDVLAKSLLVGVVAMLASAAAPLLLGRAIDEGLAHGFGPELWVWCGAMLVAAAVIVVAGIFSHTWDVENWLRAAFSFSQLIGDKASRAGHAITRRLPTGEVVAAVANDALRVGDMFAMAGRFTGGVLAYVVVALVVLSQNLTLGLVLTLGIPVVAGVLALLVKPLQSRQGTHREAQGRLTALGSDTVSGLRILRGIGGEEVFAGRYARQSQEVRRQGVRVAVLQSVLDGLQVLLPGLLVALVLWLGARAAVVGDITSGQLVAYYGYAAFLSWPVQIATQMLQMVIRAVVSSRKILGVLQVEEATPQPARPADAPPEGAELVDETSGLVLRPGRVVGLVSADPDASARIAVRLGRFDDEAEAATPVRLGGVLLADLDKETLRHRVVVSEATPHLFSGVLGEELDARGRASEADLLAALFAADAHDVLDSVPGGLEGELPEKGRSLSGGQRQRVALARALLTDPEILVLIEPTSAVDAHTEARIAERVSTVRRGRTTLVVTASPLVLDRLDEVVLLDGDARVAASGTHAELLERDDELGARYRDVVGRSMAEDTTELAEDTDELEGAAR